MEKLGECIGSRGGTWYSVGDGFFYKVNAKRDTKSYLVCAIYKCPGRAIMPTPKEDQIVNNFKMTGLHNHPPNVHLPSLLTLKETLKARSESELTPLRQIFNEETAKVHESIRGLISYKGYKSTMQRYRGEVQQAIMDALVGKPVADCVEVSATEFEQDPLSENDSEVIFHPQDQPIISSVLSSRKRKHAFLELETNKNESFENTEEVGFEESYLGEEEHEPNFQDSYYENQVDNTDDIENHCQDKNESLNDDIDQYLRFYPFEPRPLNEQCNDLLLSFFKEMEKTIRNFLPSIIIEAKSRISSLVNKLEMKNWKLKQAIKQKELEKQRNQPKPVILKVNREKEPKRQGKKQQGRLSKHLILQKQKELVQQKSNQQTFDIKQENQQNKRNEHREPQNHEVTEHELVEHYQIVDEQDQLTSEQNQLIVQQDHSIHEQSPVILEPTGAISELTPGTVRILKAPVRSPSGKFVNVRLIKAKVISVPKTPKVVETVLE